jgi:hypothetical protein
MNIAQSRRRNKNKLKIFSIAGSLGWLTQINLVMKTQPILKEKELDQISVEAQQILSLLDKIETHTIELRKKLMEELRKRN